MKTTARARELEAGLQQIEEECTQLYQEHQAAKEAVNRKAEEEADIALMPDPVRRQAAHDRWLQERMALERDAMDAYTRFTDCQKRAGVVKRALRRERMVG